MTPFLATPLFLAALLSPTQTPPSPAANNTSPGPTAAAITAAPIADRFVDAAQGVAAPAPASAPSPTPVPVLLPRQPATIAADPHAIWPLAPRPEIVRGFEPPPKPWLPGHRGLDLRGSPGQQVRSATHGKVTYAAPLAGRGVIVITNGPLRTTYEPVIPTVRAGTEVTPGTPLGTLSAAASHCAPATCLHWGLLRATTYLNPLALLPQRPIRLLPLTPRPLTPRPPTSHAQPADLPHPMDLAATPQPGQPPHSLAPPHKATGVTGHTSGSPTPDHTGTIHRASPPHQPEAAAQPSTRDTLASSVFVGLAAIATLIGSLLIRRH